VSECVSVKERQRERERERERERLVNGEILWKKTRRDRQTRRRKK